MSDICLALLFSLGAAVEYADTHAVYPGESRYVSMHRLKQDSVWRRPKMGGSLISRSRLHVADKILA